MTDPQSRPREYFVLRSSRFRPSAPSFEGFARGFPQDGLESVQDFGAAAPAAPTFSGESVPATPDQAEMLRRAPDVEAVADWLDVSLVGPMEALAPPGQPNPAETALADARAAQCAWGVAAVGATASPYTGAGVTVAILDTGLDRMHPAFQGVDIVAKNFTGRGADDDVSDTKGHGTHCAGTVFGRAVEGVRIGVAPGIKRALIGKVLGDDGNGSTNAVYKALVWAFDNGANVVSMSLGFNHAKLVKDYISEGKPVDYAASRALQAYRENMRTFERIVALIGQQGVGSGALVIAAAGNDSRRDLNPDYVIDVSMPAATLNVISVGALRRNGAAFGVADFSNSNPIASAPGFGIVSAAVGGGLTVMNGTSMACPHVAGVAALWWERDLKRDGVARADGVGARLRGRLKAVAGVGFADRGEGLACAPGADD